MNISLRLAQFDEKPETRAMLDAYLDELSPFGTFDRTYPRFDLYWQEPERKPYLIDCAEEIAGFIFLNKQSFSGQPVDRAIAEFYILPDWRKRGIARRVLEETFRLYPGWWEFCIFDRNLPALNAWRNYMLETSFAVYEEIPAFEKTIFRLLVGQSSLYSLAELSRHNLAQEA